MHDKFSIKHKLFHAPSNDPISWFTLLSILIQIALSQSWRLALDPFDIYGELGLSYLGFWNGKIWQVITHSLLHDGWLHLGANLLLIWLIAKRLLEILGKTYCFVLIMLGIFFGGAFHLFTEWLMTSMGSPPSTLVGASAVFFSLLMALAILCPYQKVFPFPICGKNMALGLLISQVLLWLISPNLHLPVFSYMGGYLESKVGESIFQISHACHLGGLFSGWLFAKYLISYDKLRSVSGRWR